MEYSVSIDNEESNVNANALSITGRVNGVPVAAKLKLTDLKGSLKVQKILKQKALVQAFNDRPASTPGGEVVEL